MSNISHDDQQQSPTMKNKLAKNQGTVKMKGDLNNFNEISESIIEENLDKLQDTEDEQTIKPSNQNHLQRNQVSGNKTMSLYDQSRVSPSKSNKIPSSLAFKRRSNDQSLQQDHLNSHQSLGQSQISRDQGVSTSSSQQQIASLTFSKGKKGAAAAKTRLKTGTGLQQQ